jgi:hypothetical protein
MELLAAAQGRGGELQAEDQGPGGGEIEPEEEAEGTEIRCLAEGKARCALRHSIRRPSPSYGQQQLQPKQLVTGRELLRSSQGK